MSNLIVKVTRGGKEELISSSPSGLKIFFSPGTSNNVVKISETSIFSNTVIRIKNSNSSVNIGEFCNVNNTVVDISSGHSQQLFISNNNTFFGAFIVLRDSTKLHIDNFCLFASGLKIFTSDAHTIYDNNTKDIINCSPEMLSIKSHVWVGCDVMILKNGSIDKDSVVAAKSVVTHNFLGCPNVIIAGNPSKIVRKGINWSRDTIPNFLLKNNQLVG